MSDKRYEDFFNDEKRLELYKMAQDLATYRGQRIAAENYRKILKSRLMKEALKNKHTSYQAQEREAYSHPDYEKVIEAIEIATVEETKAYWALTLFQTEIDVWRTEQANNRRLDN